MANLDLVALLHIFSKARLYKPICITTSSDVNLASLCMEVGQKSELDLWAHHILPLASYQYVHVHVGRRMYRLFCFGCTKDGTDQGAVRNARLLDTLTSRC